MSLSSAWTTQQVPGQLELQNKDPVSKQQTTTTKELGCNGEKGQEGKTDIKESKIETVFEDE